MSTIVTSGCGLNSHHPRVRSFSSLSSGRENKYNLFPFHEKFTWTGNIQNFCFNLGDKDNFFLAAETNIFRAYLQFCSSRNRIFIILCDTAMVQLNSLLKHFDLLDQAMSSGPASRICLLLWQVLTGNNLLVDASNLVNQKGSCGCRHTAYRLKYKQIRLLYLKEEASRKS